MAKRKINNYKDLTDEMLSTFEGVQDDSIGILKANTLVKASNSIVRIQRAKILSTSLSVEDNIAFFNLMK